MSLRTQRRRKALSMTSLIDVIFLLLLFFMLSSTFSRFAEVEIAVGGGQGSTASSDAQIMFLRITEAGISLNGTSLPVTGLRQALKVLPEAAVLLVSVGQASTAQQMADVLVATQNLPNITVSVLEGS